MTLFTDRYFLMYFLFLTDYNTSRSVFVRVQMFSLVSIVLASSFFRSIDNYGSPVPKAFESYGILLTSAAIQEMQANGISDTTVLKMVKENPNKNLILGNGIAIMLSEQRGKKEIDGVIKFQQPSN